MEIKEPKLSNYIDNKYYDMYKIFLKPREECELCVNNLHDLKEHKYLYTRAYNCLKILSKNTEYKRGTYKKEPKGKLKTALDKYKQLGINVCIINETDSGYKRGMYKKM